MYDAASSDGYAAGWNSARGTAEQETRSHLKIESRARDLYRNSPVARTIVETHEHLVVHGGVSLTLQGKSRQLPRIEELLYELFLGTELDFDRSSSFAELQSQIIRETSIAGGCLIFRAFDRNSPIGFRIKLIEQSQIATDHSKTLRDGRIVRGIELDSKDRITAYWLYPNPDLDLRKRKPTRYPRENIAHVFFPPRLGALMGISWLAPAMPHIRMLDDILHAALQRQVTSQAFSAFVTPPASQKSNNILIEDDEPKGNADDRGFVRSTRAERELKRKHDRDRYLANLAEIRPNTMYILEPGEQIDLVNPPPPYDIRSLITPILQMIAKSVGISYEALAGDFAESSYSASRMAETQSRLWIGERRAMMLSRFLEPLWGWIRAGLEIQNYNMSGIWHRWQFPTLASAHPKEEAEIWEKRIQNGSATVSMWIRESGNDPDAVFEERAAELKKMQNLGILGGMNGAGNNQSSAGDEESDPRESTVLQ